MHKTTISEVDLGNADDWMEKETIDRMNDDTKEFPDLYMAHINMIDRYNH